jgi:hypothetical protein
MADILAGGHSQGFCFSNKGRAAKISPPSQVKFVVSLYTLSKFLKSWDFRKTMSGSLEVDGGRIYPEFQGKFMETKLYEYA